MDDEPAISYNFFGVRIQHLSVLYTTVLGRNVLYFVAESPQNSTKSFLGAVHDTPLSLRVIVRLELLLLRFYFTF